MAEVNQSIKELTLTRIFDAPRQLVFKAFTDPALLAQWWGPKDFTNPVCELDVRPGGAIHIDMQWPDGKIDPMTGNFKEVVPPERLVFTAEALPDAQGNNQLVNLNTITLTEQDGKTTLTLHVQVLKALPGSEMALAGMKEGWSQSLDKLAELFG